MKERPRGQEKSRDISTDPELLKKLVGFVKESITARIDREEAIEEALNQERSLEGFSLEAMQLRALYRGAIGEAIPTKKRSQESSSPSPPKAHMIKKTKKGRRRGEFTTFIEKSQPPDK